MTSDDHLSPPAPQMGHTVTSDEKLHVGMSFLSGAEESMRVD